MNVLLDAKSRSKGRCVVGAIGVATAAFAGAIALAGCTNVMAPAGASLPAAAAIALAANPASRPSEGIGKAVGGVGIGSGWLIGASQEKIDGHMTQAARTSADQARHSPATVDRAAAAETADLNNDGFITMDEVVAMKKAGLSDGEMITRLRRAHEVFSLNEQQQDYLRDRGVSQPVIDAMLAMSVSPSGGADASALKPPPLKAPTTAPAR